MKEARRKFEAIEKETEKGSNVFKDHVSGLADKVKGTIDEVSKVDAVKKASAFTQDFGKKAEGAAKAVGSAAENIGKSGAFKMASKSAATIKEEIEGNQEFHDP